MQAVRFAVPLRRALPLAVFVVMAAAGTGYANDDTGKPTQHEQGGNNNGDPSAGVSYTAITPGAMDTGRKTIAPVDVNWTPPPCWFGPKYSAEEFKAEYLKSFNDVKDDVHGTAGTAIGQDRDHYQNGLDYPGEKGYKDFNVDQEGKGRWWAVSVNPNADPFLQMSCNDQNPVWVPNGELPPPGTGHIITVDMLSKLAYAHTHLPGAAIETSPKNTQTVNLPTWVHLTEAYTPVKVRASVDLGGGQELWAETTATPTSVRIDPGTADATLFPSSGECAIGADGQVGAAYNGNLKADPPCGVTYRRSTANRGPFQLDVTANWNVTWVGSNGGGGPLGTGTINDPHPVTVQEIQTVNR